MVIRLDADLISEDESSMGYRNLMSDIIKAAEKDLKSPKNSLTYKYAYDWFNQNGSSRSPFSFENACEILKFDPNYTREKIFKKYKIK